MSFVFQNIDPPPPSPPGECVPFVAGEDTLAGWRGGWGVNILEDARHSSVLYLYRILFVPKWEVQILRTLYGTSLWKYLLMTYKLSCTVNCTLSQSLRVRWNSLRWGPYILLSMGLPPTDIAHTHLTNYLLSQLRLRIRTQYTVNCTHWWSLRVRLISIRRTHIFCCRWVSPPHILHIPSLPITFCASYV